jgi:hypothetical protein
MKFIKIIHNKTIKPKLYLFKTTLVSGSNKIRKKINKKKKFQIFRKFFYSYNFLFLKNKIDVMKDLFIFTKFLVLKWDFFENQSNLEEESFFLILNDKIFTKKILKLNLKKKEFNRKKKLKNKYLGENSFLSLTNICYSALKTKELQLYMFFCKTFSKSRIKIKKI